MNYKTNALVFITVFLYLLSLGCDCNGNGKPAPGTTPDSNWWMHQAGLEHTGFYRGPSPTPPLQLKWQSELFSGSMSLTSPVFGKDSIFVGSGYGDSKLYALSESDGSILWSFANPPYGFYATPVAANNHVYTATLGPGSKVYALNANDGTVAWETSLGGTSGALAVGFSKVFINSRESGEQKLYALSQSTGAILWSVDISPSDFSSSSPAVGFGRVFIGADNSIYAFDEGNGGLEWHTPISGIVGRSSPVIHMDVGVGNPALVFITTSNMMLYALKESDGSIVWTYKADSSLHGSSVAVAEGKVFLFHLGKVTALDANSGTVLWHHDPPTTLFPTHDPAIANGILYYSDNEMIRGIQISDGAEVWSASIPGNDDPIAPGNSFAIDKDMVIVPSKGYIYAFTTAP